MKKYILDKNEYKNFINFDLEKKDLSKKHFYFHEVETDNKNNILFYGKQKFRYCPAYYSNSCYLNGIHNDNVVYDFPGNVGVTTLQYDKTNPIFGISALRKESNNYFIFGDVNSGKEQIIIGENGISDIYKCLKHKDMNCQCGYSLFFEIENIYKIKNNFTNYNECEFWLSEAVGDFILFKTEAVCKKIKFISNINNFNQSVIEEYVVKQYKKEKYVALEEMSKIIGRK